jgi:alpha-1,3-rhamnosyl/mannosyltransferase
VIVGVNLLWLVPGEVGGSETWITDLLRHLPEGPEVPEVVLFAPPPVLAAHPDLARRFRAVVAPAWVGPSRPLRVLAEATWLAVAARRAGVDVLYHPGGTVPVLRLTPAVVTIHDLQPLVLPGNFSWAKRLYLRARLRPSARSARIVTAISDYTSEGIQERLGVAAARLVITPPAVDVDPTPSEVDVAGLYELARPWFVYPAITYPHKRHDVVVRATAQVPDALLVLTGGAGPEELAVARLVDELGLADRVVRTGRVPFERLDALYRGAVACVFPSHYEGVGIPVLEAMARGCPVIAADATALPHVVGDAGDLVAAGDVDAWAAAMQRMITDRSHREGLIAAGHHRVRRWAPEVSAAKLVDAWRRAAPA